MASLRLNEEKRKLVDRILKNELEVEFRVIDKDYLGEFCKEKNIEFDFKILSLILPDGSISGLAKCDKCSSNFQVTKICTFYATIFFDCKSQFFNL